MFGGNSNWRGPVWFPVNYLLIESLQRFGHYHGDDITVEFPTGSGQHMNLKEVAKRLSPCRLSHIFLREPGHRAQARMGRSGEVSNRSPLSRLCLVLRILPRRQRRGHRSQPSDRLDGVGGEAPAAERGITDAISSAFSVETSHLDSCRRFSRHPWVYLLGKEIDCSFTGGVGSTGAMPW